MMALENPKGRLSLSVNEETSEPGKSDRQEEQEPVHDEFRNPDGTFKPDHPWAWKKGQSGNPRGHIPGIPQNAKLTDLMQHLAKQRCSLEGYKKLTWGEVFCLKMFEHAVKKGNPRMSKEILDRIDGTVKQVHEVEAQTKTIVEFVVAHPPDSARHEKNKQNGDLNGLTKKGDEQ